MSRVWSARASRLPWTRLDVSTQLLAQIRERRFCNFEISFPKLLANLNTASKSFWIRKCFLFALFHVLCVCTARSEHSLASETLRALLSGHPSIFMFNIVVRGRRNCDSRESTSSARSHDDVDSGIHREGTDLGGDLAAPSCS